MYTMLFFILLFFPQAFGCKRSSLGSHGSGGSQGSANSETSEPLFHHMAWLACSGVRLGEIINLHLLFCELSCCHLWSLFSQELGPCFKSLALYSNVTLSNSTSHHSTQSPGYLTYLGRGEWEPFCASS